MEIQLQRTVKTDQSTIGNLLINGKRVCFTLEDKDRDLVKTMPADQIAKVKVFARTAIPKGRYEVILSYSARFKKQLPLLLNVPGFAGIRIHSGNQADDTEGCILTGTNYSTNWIGESRKAYDALMGILSDAFAKEKVYITIT